LFHVLGIFGFDLGAKPELLAALLPRAEQLLPQLKPFEVTSMYWGLGMTRQVTCPLFHQMTDVINQLQQRQLQAQQQLQEQQQQADNGMQQKLQKLANELSPSLQRQAFQAYIAARLEDVQLELHLKCCMSFGQHGWQAVVVPAAAGPGTGGSSSSSSSSSHCVDLTWCGCCKQ